MKVPRSFAALPAAAGCAALVALLGTGCERERPAPATAATSAAGSVAAATAALTEAVCTPTIAHGKHADEGFDCRVCHACGGTLAFGSYVFPGGATTANGTIYPADAATTCSVGCHSPLGATGPPVAWNAGPLQCTSCHTNVVTTPAGPVLSSHLDDTSTPSCSSCHDQSEHTSGQIVLLNGDGTSTSSTCVDCHAGRGRTLGGRTPPLLVGWSDLPSGDFHGPRTGTCRFDHLDGAGRRSIGTGALACPSLQPQFPSALRITSRWWYASGTSGAWAWTCDVETVDEAGSPIAPKLTGQPCPEGTFLNSSCNNPQGDADCYPTTLVVRGFGGTLLAPYARGQDPLPCAACHDSHASTNAFLLAGVVNGVAIPPGTIDRAGVGAQALCNACHDGDRHEVCKSCHKETWTTDGEYSWFEGEPVDPVPDGSACFYCHGHEGIRFMLVSSPAYPPSDHPFGIAGHDRSDPACSHCHSGWAPPATEYLAPQISPDPPSVSAVTATTATVSWQTNEPATSYVAYGVGTAGFVAGDAAPVRDHAVTLAGLSPSTSYVWRVLTSDSFRNVTKTALQTFTTPGANDVPWPDVAPVNAGATVGTYTLDVALVWYPVAAPSGTAVEYEVQLASDPAFSYLVNGSIAGSSGGIGDSGWVSGAPTTYGGKPAMSHPATVTNIPQDQCTDIVPNVYYWRVRARDQEGNVSSWSTTGTFGVFAGDPWC